MPKLSNDLLRIKSMHQFLKAMKIDIKGAIISNVEGLYSFSAANVSATQLAHNLTQVLKQNSTKNTIKILNFSEIIDNQIATATCNDNNNLEIHRNSCSSIFAAIKTSATPSHFIVEQNTVQFPLPNPAYAQMFQLLYYKFLSFKKDGTLIFYIQDYLQEINEPLILIEGFQKNQHSILFFNTDKINSKQLFFASEPHENDDVKVTPYFFVPNSILPPKYRFVLDVSDSMRPSLSDLKKSVIALATQLFELQPQATIELTTFSNGVHFLGHFDKNKFEVLNDKINSLEVKHDTPLYEVTLSFIKKIIDDSGCHNNVLLFTDGENYTLQPTVNQSHISSLLDTLDKSPNLKTTRNKFYILSFKTEQNQLMHRVALTFGSDVINTLSADFLTALENPETMKNWAASRDLFTTRITVSSSSNDSIIKEYNTALDTSGQLASLDPVICRPQDTIDICVYDGDKKLVISGQQLANHNFSINNNEVNALAKTLSQMGLMSQPKNNSALHDINNNFASKNTPKNN